MTENTEQNNGIEIDISRIIYAILKDKKSINIPSNLIIESIPENAEIEIKYEDSTEEFIFSLKDNDGI